jgi:hypothetical protein
MFHLCDYNLVNGINDNLADMVAVDDTSLTRRGGASGFGHYIFPNPMNILAAMHLGIAPTEVKIVQPQFAVYSNLDLLNLQAGTLVPSTVWCDDYREMPLEIQLNQELAIQESNADGAGSHQINTLLWIAPPSWSMAGRGNYPQGERVQLNFTATIPGAAGAWSADAGMVGPTVLEGGNYSVIGAYIQGVNLIAARIRFQVAPQYMGLTMLPGTIAHQAFTDIDLQKGTTWMGEWGRFNTYMLPKIEGLASANGNITTTIRLDCVFMGTGGSLNIS